MSPALRASSAATGLIGLTIGAALSGHPGIAVALLASAVWLVIWNFEKLRASIEEKKS
jgi:hypothetical protein